MATNQEGIISSIESKLGLSGLNYNEAIFRLAENYGITDGDFNSVYSQYLRFVIGSEKTNINELEAAYSVLFFNNNVNSINDITKSIIDTVSGVEVWLDSSDAVTISQAANKVSQWDDKSLGTIRNVTQGVGSRQPLTNTNTLNNKNVLKFDGAQTLFNPTNNLIYDTSSIFVVAKADATTEDDLYGSGGSLATGDVLLMNFFNKFRGHFRTGASFNVIDSVANSTTNATIYTQAVGGGFITIRRNGTLDNSLAITGTPSAIPKGVYVGSRNDEYDNARFDGDMAEILVYTPKLSDVDFNRVGNYLAFKWGLTWNDI